MKALFVNSEEGQSQKKVRKTQNGRGSFLKDIHRLTASAEDRLGLAHGLFTEWARRESGYRVSEDTGEKHPELDEHGFFDLSKDEVRGRIGLSSEAHELLKKDSTLNAVVLIAYCVSVLSELRDANPLLYDALNRVQRSVLLKSAHGVGEPTVVRRFHNSRTWPQFSESMGLYQPKMDSMSRLLTGGSNG
jgi:hypothetical protein